MGEIKQASDGTARFKYAGVEWYDLDFVLDAEGTAAADSIQQTVSLVERGTKKRIRKKVSLEVYYTADAAAAGTLAGGSGVTPTIQQGELIKSLVVNQYLKFATDANGQAIVRFTVAGASTRYGNYVLPDGRVIQSPLMTFAA